MIPQNIIVLRTWVYSGLKSVLLVFLWLLFGISNSYAQKISFVAASSPEGITVLLNEKPLHPKTKVAGGFVGFNIYRADEGKDNFKKLSKKPLSAAENPEVLADLLGSKRLERLQKAIHPKTEMIFEELMKGDTAFTFLSFVDFKYGEAFGLVFYDENVRKGKTYQYYVTKVKADGTESEKSAVQQVTEGKLLKPIGKPTGIRLMNANNSVGVYFDKAADGFFRNVFRSEDSLGGYMKLNRLPIATNPTSPQKQDFFVDTTVHAGNYYYYTVAAKDIFGNQVFSDTVKIGIKAQYPIPVPDSIRMKSENAGARISWRIKKAENLAGFQLLRRIVVDNTENLLGEKESQFEVVSPTMIPFSDTTFVDQTAESGKNYRYKMRAVGKDLLTTSVSLGFAFLHNNPQPPLPVTEISTVPMMKAIKITWKPNDHAQVSGYMVFRTYGSTQKPEAVSVILDKGTAVFVDSSTVLSKKQTYAYYIKTFAHSGQESPFSKPVFASPLEPHHKPQRMNSLEGKVSEFLGNQLKWGLPQDQETQKVRLYRAKAGDTTIWEQVYEERIAEGLYSFRDTTAFAEGTYYKMCAVSFDDKQSDFSDILFLKNNSPQIFPPAEIIVEKTDKALKINWLAVADKNLKVYAVYRRTLTKAPEKIGEVPKGTHFFEDKTAENDLYFYFIICLDSEGNGGKASEEVSYRSAK